MLGSKKYKSKSTVLEYTSNVWENNSSWQKNELENIQRRAARGVYRVFDRNTCVTGLIRDLEWPFLETRRKEKRLRLFHKIYYNYTCIPKVRYLEEPNYIGRNDHIHKVKKKMYNRNYVSDLFFPRAIDEWNELPFSMVNNSNQAQFAMELKNFRPAQTCSHFN